MRMWCGVEGWGEERGTFLREDNRRYTGSGAVCENIVEMTVICESVGAGNNRLGSISRIIFRYGSLKTMTLSGYTLLCVLVLTWKNFVLNGMDFHGPECFRS
jgi:hypothetical protein